MIEIWQRSGRRGFTLLEMLLVVAIVATLAGSVIAALGGVEQRAEQDVLTHEIAQLQAAILQFREDTGYLPKQGPFDLVGQTQAGTGTAGTVALDQLPAIAGSDDPTRTAWFDSPANFHQLFSPPLQASGAAVLPWSADAARGWRGPYLQGRGEGWVAVGDGLTPSGGDPTSGDLLLVPGVADAFRFAPAENGALTWYLTSAATRAHDRFGRPYLLLGLDGPEADVRLVSLGADGELGTSDDVTVYVVR